MSNWSSHTLLGSGLGGLGWPEALGLPADGAGPDGAGLGGAGPDAWFA
jgi:hypothetical protein